MTDSPAGPGSGPASGEGRHLLPFVQRVARTLDLDPAGEPVRRILADSIAGAAAEALGKPRYPDRLSDTDPFTRRRLEREFLSQILPAGDSLDRLLRAGRLYECVLEITAGGGRRASGSYFTPPAIARYAALAASKGMETARFCDPACGTGNLLTSLCLVGDVPLDRILGMDRDPVAVDLARVFLWLVAGAKPVHHRTVTANIRVGDALAEEFPDAEVLISNPPFVKGVASQSASEKSDRAALKKRLPALGGAFDLASAFWALGDREGCRRTVIVVPNRLLAASYTGKLRDSAARRRDSATIRDFSRSRAFGPVAVYPVVLTLDRDGKGRGVTTNGADSFHWRMADLEGRSWSAAFSREAMQLLESNPVRLREVATAVAGQTAAEAYDLRAKIGKQGEFILVTAGAVEPHWIDEDAAQRFLGKQFKLPRVSSKDLGERRARIAASPKLLVSAMGKRVEAALDLKGRFAPAVSVFAVFPKPNSGIGLGALSAILNSNVYGPLFRSLYGAQAMSGGYISITKAMLLDLPIALDMDPGKFRRLEALGLALTELPDSVELQEEADEIVLGLFSSGRPARVVRKPL